jgi:hypothetical protein
MKMVRLWHREMGRERSSTTLHFLQLVEACQLFDPVGAGVVDTALSELFKPLVADFLGLGDLPVLLVLEGPPLHILTHRFH